MRIIAGKWRGRRIQAPSGAGTRPTGDRAREALFSSLHSRLGSFEELRILDAFAGSGALGLESLSRGAAFLVAVESSAKACRVVESNYLSLQDKQRYDAATDTSFRLYRGDIFRMLPRLQDLRIDIAFFDPPYDLPDKKLSELLTLLAQHEVFAIGALIVAERAKSSLLEEFLPEGFTLLDTKSKGDTSLYFVRRDIS
ncbi:MAG: 16S rRNA (guanine(966)-N(2))-methyltransferase RsmD [Coriobacteriia bacterium]|nr:16S rRNA (guanine(966)-N(2))-methyltransferase RsmD [Coriobacteriia bacterium]